MTGNFYSAGPRYLPDYKMVHDFLFTTRLIRASYGSSNEVYRREQRVRIDLVDILLR